MNHSNFFKKDQRIEDLPTHLLQEYFVHALESIRPHVLVQIGPKQFKNQYNVLAEREAIEHSHYSVLVVWILLLERV